MTDTATNNEQYNSTYDKFVAKVEEFKRIYQALINNASAANADPQLKSDYDSLMSEASVIQSAIQKANDAIAWVEQQIQNVENAFSGMQGNLGFLPIIAWGVAIAAMLAAIAAISYWISNAYAWAQRAHIADQITAAGGGAAAINAALNPPDKSALGNIKTIAGIGLVVYLIWKFAP